MYVCEKVYALKKFTFKMWRHVVQKIITKVSEEPATSILKSVNSGDGGSMQDPLKLW